MMKRAAFVILAVGLGCSSDTERPEAPAPASPPPSVVRRAPSTGALRTDLVGARIANEELRFGARGETWHAVSRATNLRASFSRTGVSLRSRTSASGSWQGTLRTVAIGRVGSRRAITPAQPREGACDEQAGAGATAGCLRRLEIDRGLGVVELWRNGQRGLEQGFELARRPPGAGALAIDVRFDGSLEGRLVGDALMLRAQGKDVVRYGELAAWDAAGAKLPATMKLSGDRVSLVIDDGAARYPVVVDPLLAAPSWTAESDQEGAEFGAAVASAGDVNGDGFADVIVGARLFDNGETDEGRVFVFHGSADGLEAVAAWTAESDQGAELTGIAVSFGAAVSTAGDVDGDGYDDVIVSARNYTNVLDGEGRAYVYLGSEDGLAADPVWTADGGQEWAEYGWSVAAAGDVDGDGYDDVVVGAQNMETAQSYAGRVFVYLGSAAGPVSPAAWTAESNLNSAHFGHSVGGAGDVDGDGYDDVIVTEDGIPEGVYVFHGSAGGLESSAGWSVALGGAGWSVGTAGDVNGDGYDDIVGGWGGGAFVYHGSVDGLADEPAWTASSDQDSINFGWSVSSAGDVNGDGYDDVVVGQFDYYSPEVGEGRAFLYYGSADGLQAEAGWTAESDQENAELGWSVAGAGDVDADGYDDVIVGVPFFGNGEQGEGRALLFRGQVDDGVPCDGGVWHSGECDAFHCFIDGTWTINGDSNPDDPCQVCTVATSQLDWSAAADQTDCPAGLCRAGACQAVCSIDGAWHDDGGANPDNDCEVCEAATSARAWTSSAEGSECGDGLCRAGRCDAAECYIRGTWAVNAAANPDDECEVCVVTSDRTAWTDAPDGAECAEGLCREGACQDARCYIEGDWYVDGADNPANDCQVCDVASSRVRWSSGGGAACGSADAGPDGGGGDSDGGCSCRIADGPRVPARGGLVLFALVAVLLRRRRATR